MLEHKSALGFGDRRHVLVELFAFRTFRLKDKNSCRTPHDHAKAPGIPAAHLKPGAGGRGQVKVCLCVLHDRVRLLAACAQPGTERGQILDEAQELVFGEGRLSRIDRLAPCLGGSLTRSCRSRAGQTADGQRKAEQSGRQVGASHRLVLHKAQLVEAFEVVEGFHIADGSGLAAQHQGVGDGVPGSIAQAVMVPLAYAQGKNMSELAPGSTPTRVGKRRHWHGR